MLEEACPLEEKARPSSRRGGLDSADSVLEDRSRKVGAGRGRPPLLAFGWLHVCLFPRQAVSPGGQGHLHIAKTNVLSSCSPFVHHAIN